MARIYEARVNHDDLEDIEIGPPKRDGVWIWALVFAVFLIGGATLGLTLATGSFSNAIGFAQANLAADGTGETATN